MRVPTTITGTGLPGPAPTRHQPRTIQVTVASLPGGRLRVSTPHARGWAVVVRGPDQLARAIGSAFTETACAAYAAWRREMYDHDYLTEPDDPTEPARRQLPPPSTRGVSYARTAAVRPDQAHPGAWTVNPDGSYTSPGGRTYRDPKFIARIERRRAKFNLPITGRAS